MKKPTPKKEATVAPSVPKKKSAVFSLFSEGVLDKPVLNEDVALGKRRKILGLIRFQNFLIIGFSFAIIFIAPLTQPTYEQYAMTPDKRIKPLVPIDNSIQTNAAIIFWAKSSITETMTFGFGDMRKQINAQKHLFTENGWDLFVEALNKQKILESFESRQLVLTTVPSNDGIILNQGEDKKGIYGWTVQVPIIMNFATNNNVTRTAKGLVTLKIVRVPAESTPIGIAIKSWAM